MAENIEPPQQQESEEKLLYEIRTPRDKTILLPPTYTMGRAAVLSRFMLTSGSSLHVYPPQETLHVTPEGAEGVHWLETGTAEGEYATSGVLYATAKDGITIKIDPYTGRIIELNDTQKTNIPPMSTPILGTEPGVGLRVYSLFTALSLAELKRFKAPDPQPYR